MITPSDLESVGALAGGLKPAIDLAQSVLKLVGTGKGHDEALKLYGQVVAAHQSALVAQAAQASLLKEKQELEQELGRFEDWEREKQRYHLQPIDHRAFAYIHKSGMENGEGAHWLCQPCFENRRKRVLQFTGSVVTSIGRMGMQAIWVCGECGAQVSVSHLRTPDAPWNAGTPSPPEPRPVPMKVDYDPFDPNHQ